MDKDEPAYLAVDNDESTYPTADNEDNTNGTLIAIGWVIILAMPVIWFIRRSRMRSIGYFLQGLLLLPLLLVILTIEKIQEICQNSSRILSKPFVGATNVNNAQPPGLENTTATSKKSSTPLPTMADYARNTYSDRLATDPEAMMQVLRIMNRRLWRIFYSGPKAADYRDLEAMDGALRELEDCKGATAELAEKTKIPEILGIIARLPNRLPNGLPGDDEYHYSERAISLMKRLSYPSPSDVNSIASTERSETFPIAIPGSPSAASSVLNFMRRSLEVEENISRDSRALLQSPNLRAIDEGSNNAQQLAFRLSYTSSQDMENSVESLPESIIDVAEEGSVQESANTQVAPEEAQVQTPAANVDEMRPRTRSRAKQMNKGKRKG